MQIVYLTRDYVSRLYKGFLQLNRCQIAQVKERTKDLKRHFCKDIQMVNKHMKRHSTSLVIKEIQIKTKMR